jgi:hypothetical protein
MGRILLIFLLIGLVLGCTKLSVVRITDPENSSMEGIRFYRPYPYLLISEELVGDSKQVKQDKPDKADKPDKPLKPMLQYKVIWLPDLSQEYAIRVQAGLGTVDFKPTFEEGWKLVGLDAKLDSKTKEIIEAASGLIEKGVKIPTGLKAPEKTEKELESGIYRFIYDMQPKLPNGTSNPNYGKIIGVDFMHPIATFKHQ